MIKKKLGVLAAAVIVASSANAAFDEGNAVLFAYDAADNDTYFVDLGVTASDIQLGAQVSLTDGGLASFLSSNAGSQWTIIGSINDLTPVAGPPAIGQSFANNGYISTSTTGINVGTSGADNEAQQNVMNDWLAVVQAASGGASSSFGVLGTDPAAADASRNNGFFEASLIAVGGTSSVFYAQAEPSTGASQADDAIVTQISAAGIPAVAGVTGLGEISVTSVPVPAAAWLFGSALAGLTVIRRRK